LGLAASVDGHFERLEHVRPHVLAVDLAMQDDAFLDDPPAALLAIFACPVIHLRLIANQLIVESPGNSIPSRERVSVTKDIC
jgi:hypothetical protein